MRSALLPLCLLVACTESYVVVDEVLPLTDADAVAEGVTVLSDGSMSPWFAGQFVLHVDRDADLGDPRVAERLAELGATGLTATSAPGSFRFDAGADPDDVARAFADDELVAWVEPVVRYLPQSADPDYGFQWHHSELGVPAAWNHSRGAGIVVAVVDTGVLRAAELGFTTIDDIANLLPQVEWVPVRPVALTATLSVDVPHDDTSHGTHVANTIAQRADNNLQGAGIAPEATLLPLRVGGQDGISSEHLADAIRYAADHDADIINLSLGSPIYSQLIADAVAYAVDRGALVVAASGNEAEDHRVMYPAALDGVLAIGASTSDHRLADYSNGGPELDLVAPGGDAYDGDRNGMIDGILAGTWVPVVGYEGYEDGVYLMDTFFTGTSMATATVSGAAALLMGAGASRDEVVDYLSATAVDVGTAGWDEQTGHGIVDIGAAVEAWVADHPAGPLPIGDLVAGDLVISEVMADPTVCASDTCEWFELTNQSTRTFDLAGLVVRDESGNSGTLGSVVVAPGQHLVVGRGAASTYVHPDFVPGAFYGTVVTLNNSGDLLSLVAGTTVVTTSRRWGVAPAGASLTAGETAWLPTSTLGVPALPVSREVATPGS